MLASAALTKQIRCERLFAIFEQMSHQVKRFPGILVLIQRFFTTLSGGGISKPAHPNGAYEFAGPGQPLPKCGHRVKFGNDPMKHIDFSGVTHVAKGKGIPPFLILHVAGHPDVTAQARRLGAVLKEAEIPAKVFGARETTHNKLNANLGLPDDPATKELFKFLGPLMGAKR